MSFSAESSEEYDRRVYKAVCDYEKAKQTFKTNESMAGLVQCNDEGETPMVVAMKRQTVSFIDELVTWLSQYEGYGRKMFKHLMQNKLEKCYYLKEIRIEINTYLLIFEQMKGFDPKLLSCKSIDVFTKTLNLFATYYDELMQIPYITEYDRRSHCWEYMEPVPITYARLLAPIEFITTISKFFPNPAMMSFVNFQNSCFAEVVFRFLFVSQSIASQMTQQENQNLEEYFSNYIRNFSAERTSTVLHAAVFQLWCRRDFNLDMIKLILKLGADPNAVDEYGQTALHIWATMDVYHVEECLPIFKTLVKAGTRLGIARDDGDTVICVLKKTLMRMRNKIDNLIIDPYFTSLKNTVLPLSFYCARVMIRHGIPFDFDSISLPLELQSFMASHSGEDFTDSSPSLQSSHSEDDCYLWDSLPSPRSQYDFCFNDSSSSSPTNSF